ncbi:peptidase family m28 domain-containing protein [Ditylenchus destructor]|nr:peptidase family m28 domain-containing protein [Ditylenchus destructor]
MEFCHGDGQEGSSHVRKLRDHRQVNVRTYRQKVYSKYLMSRRNWYNRQCRTFLLTLLLAIAFGEALAQWRTNQRSHELLVLSDSELADLTGKTDRAGFKELLKPILVERIVGTPQHDQVAVYLKQKAEEYGFTTEWDSFYDDTPMGNKTFHNLIATYDPMVHRRLVLACHYDSKILPGQVFLAATDSAVPCAMLLDVAKTLGPLMAYRTNKHITLQLIFLDGEEAFVKWTDNDSIYGARHLAETWSRKWYPSTDGSAFELSKEIDRMDVMMLLDLLGAANPVIRSTVGHGTSILFQNLPDIEEQLKNMRLIRRMNRIFYPGGTLMAVEDDHMPFMKKGVPIMHLIPVPFPVVWHTPDDNDSALNYDTIDNLCSIMRVFVARYLGIRPPNSG